MAVVKGTKLYPLKVVRDRPLLRVLAYFVIAGVHAAISVASYRLGHQKGMAGQEQALQDVARLSIALNKRTAEVEELEQQVANVKLGSEIDKQANEDVRQEVIALKDEVAKLQEDNSFYRNLMAPTGNRRGLTFGAVEIIDTDKPRTYSYKVVMQQLATNHQLLNGNLSFDVVGRLNGIEATFSLNQLSEQVQTDRIRLRFKYFQTIQGQMSLPEGFEPERIELVAKSTGSKPVTVEKRFGWLVEEA